MNAESAVQKFPPFIWSRSLQLPGESAFATLQKFAWANSITGAQMARQLFGRAALPVNPGHLELFEGRWINFAKLRLPSEVPLAAGLARGPTVPWMKLLCRTNVLRFCEQCLAEGFHSLLFQIEGLTRCPRHREAFRTSCRHCKTTVPLALADEAFSYPMCCPQCHEPLAPPLSPEKWVTTSERVADIERALSPITSWLDELSHWSVNVARSPMWQLSLAERFQGEPETVVNFSIAQRFAGLRLPDEICRLSRRPLWAFKLKVPALDIPAVSMLEAFNRRVACFRSVRNKLLKTALHPHRACLVQARDKVWIRREAGRQIRQQEPNVCPVAAGFLHWKAHFWMEAQDARKFDPADTAVTVEPPDQRYVMTLLAWFYSSVATAYVVEELNRKGGRPKTDIGTPHRDLLEHLCVGADSAACWIVTNAKHEASVWMVMGTAELFQIDGTSRRCDLHSLNLGRLSVWPIFHRP
jgi:hypothetical protein